ncbi:hypothetical protein E1J38_004095 [Seonamhaeicola sediminis]|uniref:Beta-carotene 15,15'-monooxygenase n=1 Tax=Seonamhaeicola sediminis TaxID=2528206 RepID=A0A562YHB1_9FLAO|nr:DUF6427 family protein [Seonamhaeicola sediminis]TWO33965.1 hypothetical protein E1J38_004095 [Seonamhaeicola sediminis]
MITSIFSKSKPVNFIIVFFIMFLAFIIARVELIKESLSVLYVAKQLGLLLTCYFTILLLNFIVSKNSLTKLNNYEILLFSLFLLLIPSTTINANILFANFFMILGLRRIMSLRSQRNEKRKLFDAAFWIAVASLFFFWAILFFVLILLALMLYTDNNIRHWIIPFIGVVTVIVISIGVSVVCYDSFFEVLNISPTSSYDFSRYNSIMYLVSITTLLSFGAWSSVFYLQNIKKQKRAYRASFKIIILAGVISFIIVLQAPDKSGSEFLFLFAPLSIIITNYIETIKEKWFKEVFLSLLAVLPLVLLVLQFFTKS